MDELFNMLSSSARLKKKKRGPKKSNDEAPSEKNRDGDDRSVDEGEGGDSRGLDGGVPSPAAASRGPQGGSGAQGDGHRHDFDEEKLRQIHREQTAAFRRSMNIRVADKHDPDLPDPISSFRELRVPGWWRRGAATSSSAAAIAANSNNGNRGGDGDDHENDAVRSFDRPFRAIMKNVESGRWKEPTPIQMQCVPALAERRDVIGSAPTGSGKTGAFVIPSLLLAKAPREAYYYAQQKQHQRHGDEQNKGKSRKKRKNKRKSHDGSGDGEGEIRCLLLAPSLELAAQLHREVQRLSAEMPDGGCSSALLSKSNASHVASGSVGGKRGLDVLVATPLRLVDCVERGGLKLDAVRVVILDEADRLLDAADGRSREKKKGARKRQNQRGSGDGDSGSDDDEESSDEEDKKVAAVSASGSAQSKTFLAQMDIILSEIPPTAVRALFSATVTPTVRSLAESILRNPVDVTVRACTAPGGANPDIEQELVFVGREEGKLLAIRQLVRRGQLRPPAIVFVESQERAQALFGELLYDGIHVDVIHAGRSRSAREGAVARFRKGDTWVLICTDLVARGVDFRAVNMVINYDLPASGVSYIHRIGRTGRAKRKGKAITLFTESDFDNLRTIANIMKQSGCEVEDWMLNMPRSRRQSKTNYKRRPGIDTTPRYDKAKRRKKQQMIEQSKSKHPHSDSRKGDN